MINLSRQVFPLSINDKELFQLRRSKIKIEIEIKQKLKISVVFNSQIEFAKTICDKFDNPKTIFVMAIAQMQVGKTGTMVSLIEQYIDRYEIPIENIYIITGLSSKSWKEQTRKRFPEILENQIYHRNELKQQFKTDIIRKKDVLLILDEVHIAAQKKQTIHTTFDELSFVNREIMYMNNIKVIEFSATPDGVIKDRQNWGDAAEVVIGAPGLGYKGVFDFLDEGRIFQSKELFSYQKKGEIINQEKAKDNISELGYIIMDKYGLNKPKYHIIRTPTGKAGDVMIGNFKEMFGNFVNYRSFNGMSEEYNINTILDIEPKKHTFVFIMELMRCADTINKKYIGVLYERSVKYHNDSTQTQGLAGRACGYDDTGETIIFVNIESIELYRKHYESGFTRDDLPWNCNTKNGSFASECSDSDTDYILDKDENYGFKVFENDERYNNLEIFTLSHLNGWKPRKNIGININELKNHTSYDLIKRHWGLSKKTPKRIAKGTDGKWVVWWLKSHYPNLQFLIK